MKRLTVREYAKKRYEDRTNNHPTIHCNRFPSWEELTDAEREKLVQEIYAELETLIDEGEKTEEVER